MITLTFDLTALVIGFFLGMLIGGIILSLVELREGGPWSSGWTAGYRSGTELRKYIEQSVKNEKAVIQNETQRRNHPTA